MNTFAHLLEIKSYRLVKYYTVRFEDEQYNEFAKFVLTHNRKENIATEYNDVMAWIKFYLGERYGALEKYFRHEKKAQALPPSARFLEINYEVNLRLYCYRISDHVVILFNGGVKTNNIDNARDCPVVGKHFDKANLLCAALDKAFISKEIQLNNDLTELIFEPDFILEI